MKPIDFHTIQPTLSGSARFDSQFGSETGDARNGIVLSAGQQMKVHHEPESSILSLIVKEEVLRDAVSAWTGHAKFPRIRFQARFDPNDPRGADSAWSNPVGMTGIDEQHIMAGFKLVLPSIKLDTKGTTNELGTRPILADNGGNAGEIAPVPSVFYVKPHSDRARFGFSLTGPLGGGVDYGEDFVGPYSIQNVTLAGVAITPSFGCQVVHSPDQRGRAALKKQVPRRRLAELCANRPASNLAHPATRLCP